MAARPAAEEDLLEVRCAGCGETLEVERGLTEFACPEAPDCATPQALPLELMPPPLPPRRRRAVPLPSAPGRAAPPPASAARLPCGACGALLSVPPGLARCGCPVCGAELAVDPARLRRYLEATAAPPLVPVSPPPVFQAREVQQEYPDSAVRVGHIQGYPNTRLVHVERSQIRCRNTKALSGYPDAHTDRDDMDTEVSDEINAMHCHMSGFSVDSRASNAKRRQVEALNHVVYQVQSQQTNYSVHAEGPDHAIHVGEAHNKYLNHAVHKKRQAQTLNQTTQQIGHTKNLSIAKQSAAITYYESGSEGSQAASSSQSISSSLDIDQSSDDSSSSLQPQHDMPQRSSNEAGNLDVTMQTASSIPDMTDPESFARYYSKVYPPEVRRALESNSNVWLERVIHQSPSSYLHAGGKEKRRRGRGCTLCLKIWTMPEGVRIPVSLNDLGQPIENEADTLGNFLGTIARDVILAPLTYTDWRRFPEKNKDVMWHLVNLKFVIAPVGEIWTMKALGKKWKDWKAILKHERYDVHETDEERLADRNSRVPEEQWKCLVAYWGTEKAKAASARCRALRARQPIHRHRAGSKSYARIREEERQKRPDKEEPSRTDIFILTHTPKDGKERPIDQSTADVISRLLEEARKRQKGLASGSMDDVFSKIVGPDTRDTKRTYGPVPCTSELRGKTAAKVSLRLAHAAKRNAEEAAATLRKKMMEMEENNRKLKEDLASVKSPASGGVKDRRMSTDDLQKNQHMNH
ncbi:unnamed protein product [Urochloa decumbens]|uniref:Uncharacterized protein n=1 Tax=Urochloa decumbens TaxID=240449 RepID=A0ABC9GAR1_9POAL